MGLNHARSRAEVGNKRRKDYPESPMPEKLKHT